jgi:hypothetical protein
MATNMRRVRTGKQFNEAYKNVRYVLVAHENKPDAYGTTYRSGINIDPQPFNGERDSRVHRFKFCPYDQMGHHVGSERWASGFKTIMYDVVIPDNAKVVVLLDYARADRFILTNPQYIFKSPEIVKHLIQTFPSGLEYAEKMGISSDDLNVLAVKAHGTNMARIKNPSDKVKYTSVMNHPWTIKSISNPTLDMCLITVHKNPQCIYLIKDKDNFNKCKDYLHGTYSWEINNVDYLTTKMAALTLN